VGTARPGKSPAEVEAALNAEIEKLKAAPPTPEEVERAYNEYEAGFIYGIQTVLGKADQLNGYNTYLDKPDYFRQDLARYRAVTPADVQRVARKYLTDKRVVMSVVPRGPQNKGGGPVAAGPKQAAGAVATQQAAGTAPRTAPGERPAGAQPQTKAEAAQTRPAGASPQQPAVGAEQPAAKKPARQRADTSKLPKGGPDPKFTLPPVQRRKLSNGLDVLVVEHKELPVVQMNLVVKTGGAADPADRAGLASMTAAMLDEGTKTRTALDISNQLAAVGATLNTNAGWDSSSAGLLTLTRHLDRALDVYADVVLNPAFPQEELARQRAQRLAAFRQRRDNPNQIAEVVYPSLVYGRQHPYGHPLTGEETSVGAMTAEDVRRFYQTYYRPNNAALIVVGDVTPDSVVPKLERAFGKWRPPRASARPSTSSTAPARRNRS
jgi:zinc protease